MKSPRTIQVDALDSLVFRKAKKSSTVELTISRDFVLAAVNASTQQGVSRAAICSDFFGPTTLGWSTLVKIADDHENKHAQTDEVLARLTRLFDAPELKTAWPAAEPGLTFCDQTSGTAIAATRSIEDEAIFDGLRTLLPSNGANRPHARAFLEVEDKTDGPAQQVDLATVARGVCK
jgi:hypothetical protein